MSKFARKHSLGLLTVAAFVGLLVISSIVSAAFGIRARRAEQEALVETAIAKAVTDFLRNDVLAQASANRQAAPTTKPDLDLRVRTALDRAAAGIENKFTAQPLVEASIRQTIGTTYVDLGLYPEAEQQLDRALELRRRVLGETHADTLSSMNDLGDVYTYEGKYTQAEAILRDALEIGRKTLGEAHPKTMDMMNNLGFAYWRDGKFSQAEPLYVRALALRRRVLGEDAPDTLVVANNLAALYYRQEKYGQAEPIFKDILKIRGHVLGDEHPQTLISMNNLAMTYRAERNYREAEKLFISCLDLRRHVLGEQHPDTMRSMNNRSAVLRSGQVRGSRGYFTQNARRTYSGARCRASRYQFYYGRTGETLFGLGKVG